MKTNIYAIFDSKADAFGQPFYLLTDGLATRSFQDACRNPESEFQKHPMDYSLYVIGEYDDTTATIIQGKPDLIITARDALSSLEEEVKQFRKEGE